MATPITGTPEWNPASADGPGQTAASLRALEKFTVMRFTNASQRDSVLTGALAPVAGQVCTLADDVDGIYRYGAGKWNRLTPQRWRMDAGVIILPASGASVTADDITFQAGLFDSNTDDWPVYVQVSNAGTAYNSTVSGISATKATASANRTDGANINGSVTVFWNAFQREH